MQIAQGTMALHFQESHANEELRIRASYARRSAGSLYSWFNPAQLFLIQERERHVLAMLHARNISSLQDKTILEIGCGDGYWLRQFINWGARPENVRGIDLLPERVKRARELCPQSIEIECGNAAFTTFPDSSFDIVLQSTVFTSVLDSKMKTQMASEMLRVAKGGAHILWYDFTVSNPRNPDVRGIRTEEIYALFPRCHIELRRITLAPPLARVIAPYSRLACSILELAKIFNTHYLGIITKH